MSHAHVQHAVRGTLKRATAESGSNLTRVWRKSCRFLRRSRPHPLRVFPQWRSAVRSAAPMWERHASKQMAHRPASIAIGSCKLLTTLSRGNLSLLQTTRYCSSRAQARKGNVIERFELHSTTADFVRRTVANSKEIESVCLRCFATVARSQELSHITAEENQHDCPAKQRTPSK
jgi:hypothetical protein